MAETPRKERNAFTFEQMYKACEVLKANKQPFLDDRPTHLDAAKRMTTLCGFEVSVAHIPKLQALTGITWVSPQKAGGKKGQKKDDAIAMIGLALYRLYRKLGEEPPEALQRFHDENAPPTPPVNVTLTTDPLAQKPINAVPRNAQHLRGGLR